MEAEFLKEDTYFSVEFFDVPTNLLVQLHALSGL
tara:strand:- start:787 stop:888 length:102 start_codon:yes stop_codon:yes gene_type:complete